MCSIFDDGERGDGCSVGLSELGKLLGQEEISRFVIISQLLSRNLSLRAT